MRYASKSEKHEPRLPVVHTSFEVEDGLEGVGVWYCAHDAIGFGFADFDPVKQSALRNFILERQKGLCQISRGPEGSCRAALLWEFVRACNIHVETGQVNQQSLTDQSQSGNLY